MIKDKITPELRSRFLEDIKLSKESGKERGFFICENKDGKLLPSSSCEGTECDIRLGDPKNGCPNGMKNQGEFHTHPYTFAVKKELIERGEIIPTDQKLREMMDKNIREAHQKITKVQGITIDSPSYTDAIRALLSKYIDVTKGTVCTASDAGDHRVECWTIRDIGKDELRKLSILGLAELNKTKPEGSQLTRKWIADISERETIYLY